MKILMMCEGSNELEVMRILLNHHCLKYAEDDLLGLTPYHARQIEKSSAVKIAMDIYQEKAERYLADLLKE